MQVVETFYVMETINKARYLINENEKNALYEAIRQHENHVVLQGEMIPLSAPPAVMKFARWYAKENERLAVSLKRLCKKCLKVIGIQDRCLCWKSEQGKNQDAFIALPDEIRGIIHGAARGFPALTPGEKAQIEYEKSQMPNQVRQIETSGVDAYIDAETGEEIFS